MRTGYRLYLLNSHTTNIMKRMLILVIICGGVLLGTAQKKTTGSIKGRLMDTVYKESMDAATVSVLQPSDSTVLTYMLANAKGEFEFKGLNLSSYRLLITFQGYRQVRKNIMLSATAPIINVGNIYLEKNSTTLEEVVVEVPPIQVKKDTVEYNASAFKTIPNATAEDLFKKLPGVDVDKDGNVTSQGEIIQKIYVDGKEFFGTDPKLATKNITADMIESVQVYDDMSDQAKFTRIDDGSRAKTINIKLKKNRRKGYFGRAIVGAGDNDRYQSNLTFNKFNDKQRFSFVGSSNNINKQGFNFSDVVSNMGGFSGGGARGGGGGNRGGGATSSGINKATSAGLNYTDKIGTKLDVTGSYFYSNTENRNAESSLRQTFFPKDSVTYANDQSESLSKNINHRFNLRMEYYIDSMNSLLYTPTLTFQKSSSNTFDTSFTRTTQPAIDFISLSGVNRNISDRDGVNLNNNLLYRRKFHKVGRTFTLGMTNALNNSDGSGTNYYPLTFYNHDGSVNSIRYQNFKSSQKTRSDNNVFSTSYTEPIGKNKILELNYAYTDNHSTSDRKAYNYNKVTNQFDSLNLQQTNYFENTFLAHRAGFNFRVQNTKYNFQIGGGIQNATQESRSIRGIYRVNGKDSVIHYKQNYTNFFPTANFNYNFSRTKNFRFSYQGRSSQPTVTQLQDVRDETNSLRTVQGNPDLKQQFNNSINAVYNAFNPSNFKFLNASLNYSTTANKIVNSIDFDSIRGKGVQLIRPVNLNGAFNASSSVTLGIPLRKNLKGSNINFTNSINFNRDVSALYKKLNYTNNLSIRQKIGVNMDIRDKLNFGINATVAYNTVHYSTQQTQTQNLDTKYFSQTYSTNVTYFVLKTLFVSTDFDCLINTGRAAGFNQTIPLWNASIAQQVFKKKNGEIRFSVNDLLNQNKSINRVIGENYIDDSRTMVLKRYFQLMFTYNLNRTGAGKRGQSLVPFQRGGNNGGGMNRGGGNRGGGRNNEE